MSCPVARLPGLGSIRRRTESTASRSAATNWSDRSTLSRVVDLDRPLTELGRLEVTAISPTSAADERGLVFDPTNRTDGIDLSADPILLARSAAYSISYDHRSKGA